MGIRLLVLLVAATVTGGGLLAFPGHVHAEPDAATEQLDYATLIRRGVEEFAAERYPEALALFERAHRIRPNARTLRGIGMTAFEMRDYPRAWVALKASLASRVQPLTSSQRTEVQGLIQRTDELLGRVEVLGVPDDPEVLVDGGPPTYDEGTILVGPGRHEITVRAPAGAAWSRSIDATGATQTLQLSFVATAVPEPTGAGARRASASRRGRFAPWYVAGAGVVVGVTGLSLGASALRHASGADTPSDDDRAIRMSIAGDTLMVVGGAAAIGGLVWGLVARRGASDGPSTRAELLPTAGGARVHIRHEF